MTYLCVIVLVPKMGGETITLAVAGLTSMDEADQASTEHLSSLGKNPDAYAIASVQFLPQGS